MLTDTNELPITYLIYAKFRGFSQLNLNSLPESNGRGARLNAAKCATSKDKASKQADGVCRWSISTEASLRQREISTRDV